MPKTIIIVAVILFTKFLLFFLRKRSYVCECTYTLPGCCEDQIECIITPDYLYNLTHLFKYRFYIKTPHLVFEPYEYEFYIEDDGKLNIIDISVPPGSKKIDRLVSSCHKYHSSKYNYDISFFIFI